MAVGILAFGAYIPRLRLARSAIADANAWFNPSLKVQSKGERAMCNWDEDPVTMAVEAARDALVDHDRNSIEDLKFASTTFPFLDRLNSGIVKEALQLNEDVTCLDTAATQRAATSALTAALGSPRESLIVAAEQRRAPAASVAQMANGDGAAAILVGEGDAVAQFVASATHGADFVDHYRTVESGYDYQWEERWIRDAGYLSIVPHVIARSLDKAGLAPTNVTHFCMPAALPKIANAVAKAAGIPQAAVRDNLHSACGDTGTAHPLIMLVSALEEAKPGDRILVVGFGQGADALLLEVTPAIVRHASRIGIKGHLARRRAEPSYMKFLAFNDIVEVERGMRAETDKLTPLSALWRNRELVTGFVGGECTACGTRQIPKSRICVNPNCGALDTQKPHGFAEKIGRVKSFTADRLTYSPDPPACYGMIDFENGGRWMMDFTDVEANDLGVGQSVRAVFRIKDIDTHRGFRRYFWKATPVAPARA